MKNKNKYLSGKDAVNKMRYIVGELLWTNRALPCTLSLSLQEINEIYQGARDSAMAFGEDVSKYPKRIRWRTAGAELLERGWRKGA